MAEAEVWYKLENKSIETRLEIFKLAKEYLEIQSKLCHKFKTILFSKPLNSPPESERAVRGVLLSAQNASTSTEHYIEAIRGEVQDLTLMREEQAKISREFLEESSNLNELISEVTHYMQHSSSEGGAKRPFEDYKELEERASKVLKACKRLTNFEYEDAE